ncbi:MAG: FadR family transcriptional regulator [Rubrivivax sp.]|nr:FadR family transcriptional regulator [Rubrivivax sp.]
MRHRLDAKLPEQLALKLERAILAQEHQPGERLPAERGWALKLGVSRAALREALGMLAERGLLERRHGAGTFVSERPDERRADPWRQMLQRQPGMQTDLLEFREMLEIRCAELAAARAQPADLERLARCHGEVSAAYAQADRARQVQADVAFHRAIAQATRNPVFAHLVGSLLELLHEHVLISIAGLQPESADVRRLRRQHAQLLERICAHDVRGAAAAARGHIHFVRRSWQKRLG